MALRAPCLLIVLPLVAMGCARTSGVPPIWISQNGGLLEGEAQRRPSALMTHLAREEVPAGLNVHVLSSTELAAYSWPDGSVFVTAALVDQLDDAELSAALAHELGHLLSDGRVASPVGLIGDTRDTRSHDKEERADAIGVELLKRRRVPEQAMISMLEKIVAGEAPGSPCRRALARRIERLRRATASARGSTTD